MSSFLDQLLGRLKANKLKILNYQLLATKASQICFGQLAIIATIIEDVCSLYIPSGNFNLVHLNVIGP